jgi:uncharacterized membrane protein
MDGRLLALTSAFLFSLGPVILTLGLRKASADLAVVTSMVVGLPLLLLVSPLLGGLHLAELTLGTITLFGLN